MEERKTFENYRCDDANKLAFACAKRISELKDRNFSPLYICGLKGTGKSHLLEAIANQCRENKLYGENIKLITIRELKKEVDAAKDAQEIMQITQTYRQLGLLLVDDLQDFQNYQEDLLEEVYFEILYERECQNKQTVIAADRLFIEIDGLSDRVKAYINRGFVAEISDKWKK